MKVAERLGVRPWELGGVPILWRLRTEAAIGAEGTKQEDHYTPR